MSLSRKPIKRKPRRDGGKDTSWRKKRSDAALRYDWSDAEAKRKECRICKQRWSIELAHTFNRSHQNERRKGPRGGKYAYVPADAVVPLCLEHHRLYDAHKLPLIGHLTMSELRNIIKVVGKHRARRRLEGKRA